MGSPKRAAVPIPLKGIICIQEGIQNMPVAGTPVINSEGVILVPELFLLSTATLNGHATHMGNFIVEQTSMTGVSGHLDIGALLSQGKIVFIADYYGSITAANGDHFDFVSSIVIDATNADASDQARGGIITGTFTVTGGTGRFENATGGGVLNGILPCWYIDGTLEFSR